MAGSMVRISEQARNSLRALAEQDGQSMQAVLDRAIESYRRQRMLESVNAAYASLSGQEWAEVGEERRLWDGTLGDGLDTQDRSDADARSGGR